MLVVELTAILTTVLCFIPDNAVPTFVAAQIALWLWFTVLFANFAEALAEGRGKARADSLKAGSEGLSARRKNCQWQLSSGTGHQPAQGRCGARRSGGDDSR